MAAPKKVVLAYSGGLDTSIILKWLQTEYDCEVITFTADLGQGEELDPARKKARAVGHQARELFSSKICVKNMHGILYSQCFVPMPFTKDCTFWERPSRGL